MCVCGCGCMRESERESEREVGGTRNLHEPPQAARLEVHLATHVFVGKLLPRLLEHAPDGTLLNLRTTAQQKYGAVPRRARIQGS